MWAFTGQGFNLTVSFGLFFICH